MRSNDRNLKISLVFKGQIEKPIIQPYGAFFTADDVYK